MKKQILLFIFILQSVIFFGQKQENPIIFTEGFINKSTGKSSGWLYGFNVNYQFQNNLLTYRQLTLIDYEYKGNALIFIPIFETKEIIDENALLYGKRYIFDNLSLSYSGGISVMNREFTAKFDENEQRIYEKETYFGFPFELNIKWFKPEKRRLRIYYVIPVGQPTSFGGSFGFKIIGNVSKQSFVGIGISYGYGWHKIY